MNESKADVAMKEGALIVQQDGIKPVAPMPLQVYEVKAASPAQGKILTTYDMNTRAGKMGVFRATQRADLEVDGLEGKPMSVRDIVIHPVSIVNKDTHEITDSMRCVLIAPDGKRLAMVSEVALPQVMMIADIYGPGPWEPPVLVAIKVIKTTSGYRTYELHPDPASGPKEAKAKR